MTKVYLVECYAVTTGTNNPCNWVMQVFTNFKLARIYAEYWQYNQKATFDGVKDVKIKVTPFKICKLDYTKELNEIKSKTCHIRQVFLCQ